MSRIFISYSHRGNGPKRKERLLRALHVFEQHYLLDVRQDGKILVNPATRDGCHRRDEELADAKRAILGGESI